MRQRDIQRGRDMWLGGWTRGEVARSTRRQLPAELRVIGWDECEAQLSFLGVVGNLGNVATLPRKD